MNDVAANTGDTTVHYACDSGTLSVRNRLNAAKDAKSDVSGARSFPSEIIYKDFFYYIYEYKVLIKII